MSRTLLMPAARVRRTLQRIACEVIERNRGGDGLLVFGVRRRGVEVAARLAVALEEVAGRPFEVYALDVTAYRDDRPPGEAPEVIEKEPDVEGADALIVDDVLFTGRTARAAIDAVLARGRPRSIQLAALIDRGHREFPIQPDYVGRVIPTKYGERVVVEIEGDLAVYLEE
ncbi:MAG TPA: bifunctional pyr operon transcriptional regulator/uracil phosphoribosyltransferase PyrR [Rhodothermales bacterium]|nr:bifunctional pyr operon transcriptional regulator/uracil phosphoribosyltransferase PyrR [Rhodothermales bacterium]